MTEINTLTQFLSTANTQFQVYDLGRRVQHIDMVAFQQIENLATPYPYPLQGHAQFAVVFWDKSMQHYIWFLKLPLCEQGKLMAAPRTQFIKMVIEALGRNPAQVLTEAEQEKLANHPFAFKPSSEKLAIFNALVRQQLGLPASQQYEFAYQYLSQQHDADKWQQVGYQGLADICVNASKLDHLAHLKAAFGFAANEVKIALCQQLEHLYLDQELATIIYQSGLEALQADKVYYLRALASHTELAVKFIHHLAEHELLNDEILIAIAARCWNALKDDPTRSLYLEALAKQPQSFFNQVFADIVAIPSLRTEMLKALRDPNRSPQLSAAIGGLFKVTKA
ncbi:DUF3549 family protein [Shewanella waksmanii]|uniref:DUF3549 family protein n=1 Tax=Shewanella waksmanii TaxID=213783 RepID=UPI00373685D5